MDDYEFTLWNTRILSIQSSPSTPFLCPRTESIESWLAWRSIIPPRKVQKELLFPETQRAECFVMLSQKVTPRAKKPRTENLIRTCLLTNSHPISKVIRAHDRFHPVNRVPSNGQPDEDQTTRGHAISSSRTPPGRRCKS